MKEAGMDVLTAVYIVKGFFEIARVTAISETQKWKEGGEINLVDWLSHLSIEVESRWDEERDFPGVWLYDVAEPLGNWVAHYINEHFETPEPKLISEKITELVDGSLE